MKLSTERKVYVAILGIGLLVLAVDRALLTPGGAAAAGDTAAVEPTAAAPTAPQPAPAAAPVAASSTQPPGVPFAQGLRDVLESSPSALTGGDAFGGASPETSAPNDAGGPKLRGPTGRLSTIVTSDRGGVAMIDGKPYQVGDVVDGFRLVMLDAQGAHFERDGQRVTLMPSEPAGRASTRPR